jgi:hypothetical protein
MATTPTIVKVQALPAPKFIPQGFKFGDYVPAGCRVIAHWMNWFGYKEQLNAAGAMRMDSGYKSDDFSAIVRQLDAMQAVGVTDVNAEYYGHWKGQTKPWYHRAVLRMLHECEKRSMGFSVDPTSNAISEAITDKTDAAQTTQAYIDMLNYCAYTFFPSPAYMTDGGRPLVNFFSPETYPLDWVKIRAGVKGNPKFLFRGASGFDQPQSDGAFDWVNPWSMGATPAPDPNDPNLGPHKNFYAKAAANPAKVAWGAVYPGFDDSTSAWGANRLVNRRNGLTFLQTLEIVPSSLKYLMLTTWNDLEEQTDFERWFIPSW